MMREDGSLLVEVEDEGRGMPARGNNVAGAEAHRANIMHKLNLHTVGDLIRHAIGNKIVEG